MMTAIMTKLMSVLPFVTAFAQQAPAGNATVSRIVAWIGGIGGGIVAIMLIISLVKDGIGIAKGSGDSSVLKIAGKILFLIIIIGLIAIAVNYASLQTMGQGLGNKAINEVNSQLNSAF
jgi:uncharacterized membrane protein YdbT with pleckstrin-like domain